MIKKEQKTGITHGHTQILKKEFQLFQKKFNYKYWL